MLPEPTLKPALCLDALEANLKTVLLHTGSALSEPSNFEPTNVNQTKARLGNYLPPALDEFSRALRNLELELIRAKSALNRDLTSSREARLAAASKATSGNSPQPIDIDADTVMIEAPTKKGDSGSKGEETGTSQGAPDQANSADMEIDLFEHPKPSNESEQTANTSAQQDAAKDVQAEQSQQPGSSLRGGNIANDDTAASGTTAAGNVTSADRNGDQAKPSSTANGTNNDEDDDDLSLLFGVEQYATDENSNDVAGNNAQSQTDSAATKQVDGQDANAADQATQNQDQSQVDNSLDNDDANGLAEGLDFDFNTFDFGLDADNMADSNLDGTGQGDSQGWDSTFFDENFFNLDALN